MVIFFKETVGTVLMLIGEQGMKILCPMKISGDLFAIWTDKMGKAVSFIQEISEGIIFCRNIDDESKIIKTQSPSIAIRKNPCGY